MKKIVLVNATSLYTGGALTILNQYIVELNQKADDDKTYYLFVPDTCTTSSNLANIHYIKNSENTLYTSRNYWNLFGLKKWCRKNDITPYELYSMQNYYPFGFNSKELIRSLYLHQSSPFFDYKWSIFKEEERIHWFYKNIYYLLIKRSIKQSNKVIVQTEWFKNQIIKKTKIDPNKVNVIVEKPNFKSIDPNKYSKISGLKGKVKLFYPAHGMIYKNHEVLYRAINIIVNELKIKDIVLYLTLNNTDVTARRYIDMYNISNYVVLTGHLNYEQVMNYYKTVDALVFPSKVETFGLPLVEVQYFGLPIIGNDLDLFREVIGDYKGKVTYCNSGDAQKWAESIKNLLIIS